MELEQFFLADGGDEFLEVERFEVGHIPEMSLIEFLHCRHKH